MSLLGKAIGKAVVTTQVMLAMQPRSASRYYEGEELCMVSPELEFPKN